MNPPQSARPRVWWHWMNGNITKEGIQKDLEWMERSGIAGFQNFDANLFTPVVVKKKLVYMTPEWKDAFRFTTSLAKEKKLEMAIAGSPGWSVTGGPWVAPKDGMKKYVWSTLTIQGGQTFKGPLPLPPATTGRMQNVPTGGDNVLGGAAKQLPKYYADAFVIAYRLPEQEKSLQELNPRLSASGGNFTTEMLTDGDIAKAIHLPFRSMDEDMWIQYEFDSPITFKAFTVAGANHIPLEDFNGGPKNRFLEVSNDGINFKTIASVSGSIVPQNTVSFPATTAKYWRLVFKPFAPPVNEMLAMFGMGKPKPEGVNVAEFILYNTDRIDQFEDKAGFDPWKEINPLPSNEADAIAANTIINLSDKMDASGNLNWDVPAGKWTIIRLGYSLTGRENHPASPEATGLEVDKLDKDAVRRYINTYLDMYKDATGGMMGKEGLTHMILDSYEAGHMNWTAKLPEAFKNKRGYDIYPWIPVLTGRVINSRWESEKFLWDFRKTIGEMIAENHYDVIGEELHKRGMKRYTESHENMRIYLADGMDVKRNADIPMSAMWQPGALAEGPDEEIRSRADIRESASVAHIYGQNIVAGESMTTVRNSFSPHPGSLKRTADMEMASGLNRFIVHTSVHQPIDSLYPGFSLGPFGQWFTRQETWAEQARSWTDYLARSSYLLQQGRFVADILYYYGENTNITSEFTTALAKVPSGYEYDFANATVLLEAVAPQNGKLVTKTGMKYSILVLDATAKTMTLKVLKKILEFAKAGIVISGQKPLQSPSLADDPKAYDATLKQLLTLPNVKFDADIRGLMQNKGLKEDLIISGAKAEILYVHRSTADREIYWLNSRTEKNNEADISFRVKGKIPKRLNPETGTIEPLSYEIKNGRTYLSLKFSPWDATFIIFEGATKEISKTIPEWKTSSTQNIEGSWTVKFQEKRSAPKEPVVFPALVSLTDRKEEGIKYFSGLASYQKEIEIKNFTKDDRLMLNLGEVKNLAEVYVNGKKVGTLWKVPFSIDIAQYVHAGNNQLEVRVINSWVNRLVGDAQPGAQKITFMTMPLIRKETPLEVSGLLGPVKIEIQQRK